jgi:hypothetical protein
MQTTKIKEFEVLDSSADKVTLEEWQEWVAPGEPGRKFLLLPTGLHVNKIPGRTGRYEIVQTGEELRTEAPDAP